MKKSKNGKASLMKNKNYKIVNLRAIAIILVVLGHSIIIYKSGWNYYHTEVNCQLFNYLDLIIYLFHMPLFFSISGYLFIDKCKQKNISTIVKNKFKRLIIPYVVVGILWVYPIRIISQYSGFAKHGWIYNILVNIILGADNGHLWFLPALFSMFVISYFLEKYVKNNTLKYLLIFIMFLLGHILSFSWISETFKYIVWFYLGYFIKKYSVESKMKYKKATIILTVILVTIYIFTYNWNVYFSLSLKYMICLVLIPLLYNIITSKPLKILESISNYSFGIYLFHSPMIYITFNYLPNINPFFMLLINFLCCGLFAYFITYFISKSKYKFMIGG
jgi:peptidoglycan/LPS O-acetylase OafA/YrhL